VDALHERVGRDEQRSTVRHAERRGVVADADADRRATRSQARAEPAKPLVLARGRGSTRHGVAAGQPSMDFTLSRKLFDIG
jgi:hypothetical protein